MNQPHRIGTSYSYYILVTLKHSTSQQFGKMKIINKHKTDSSDRETGTTIIQIFNVKFHTNSYPLIVQLTINNGICTTTCILRPMISLCVRVWFVCWIISWRILLSDLCIHINGGVGFWCQYVDTFASFQYFCRTIYFYWSILYMSVCVCVCRLHANLFLTEKSIDMHDNATCEHRHRRRPFRHCNGLHLWNWLWNLTRWNDISAPTTTGWPSIAHVLHTHKECASTKLKYMIYIYAYSNQSSRTKCE